MKKKKTTIINLREVREAIALRGGSYFKKATRKSSRELKIASQTFLNIINRRIRRQSRTSPRKHYKKTDTWQIGEEVRKWETESREPTLGEPLVGGAGQSQPAAPLGAKGRTLGWCRPSEPQLMRRVLPPSEMGASCQLPVFILGGLKQPRCSLLGARSSASAPPGPD